MRRLPFRQSGVWLSVMPDSHFFYAVLPADDPNVHPDTLVIASCGRHVPIKRVHLRYFTCTECFVVGSARVKAERSNRTDVRGRLLKRDVRGRFFKASGQRISLHVPPNPHPIGSPRGMLWDNLDPATRRPLGGDGRCFPTRGAWRGLTMAQFRHVLRRPPAKRPRSKNRFSLLQFDKLAKRARWSISL